MSECMPSSKITPNTSSAVLNEGVTPTFFEYRAMRCFTNVWNHKIVNLDCFMKRVVFALYPGLFRKGMLAVIDCKKNDRQHEQEIRIVDKRTSNRRKNLAFVIRATILKHRSVLGHVIPSENCQI